MIINYSNSKIESLESRYKEHINLVLNYIASRGIAYNSKKSNGPYMRLYDAFHGSLLTYVLKFAQCLNSRS